MGGVKIITRELLGMEGVSSIKATISLADGDYLGLSEEQDLKKLRKHQKLTRNNLIKYLTKLPQFTVKNYFVYSFHLLIWIRIENLKKD